MHLDCLQLEAIINKAIIGIHMEAPTWALVFTYIAQTPTSKIARSHGKCTFSCQDMINPLSIAVLYYIFISLTTPDVFLFSFPLFLACLGFYCCFLLETGSRAVPAGFKLDMWTKMSLGLSSYSFCLPRT